MRKSRYQLPKDPRRREQVQTFLSKHGREGYRKAGAKGGGANSPGSFTSESGRKATLIGWEKRRARAAEQLKEQEASDGSVND